MQSRTMQSGRFPRTVLAGIAVCLLASSLQAEEPEADQSAAIDYGRQIAPLFQKHCNACHSAEDAEGDLVLENFAQLMRGGESGVIVVPGKPEQSRLLAVVEQRAEPFMPPEGNPPLTDDEVALLKRWIQEGAKPPTGDEGGPLTLSTPRIEPRGPVRDPIHSVVWSPNGEWVAVARYGAVEIRTAEDHRLIQQLSELNGNVNALGISADGTTLFAASGEAGLFGEATLWNTSDWQPMQTLRGHRDSLYAIALSPDGKILATGSYDQTVKLWDLESGEERHSITSHNGPIFDLAFHPEGRILASASGDRTVKLWNVETGERLDTFGQPDKDQYAVAFSPDGRFVVAGGVDNRIRVWELREGGREGASPLLYSRFAHEAPILNLVFSPNGQALVSSGEDRTLKVWEAENFTQRQTLEEQPDWPSALAISPRSDALLAGRLDGTLNAYPLETANLTSGEEIEPITLVPIPPMPHGDEQPAELPQVSEAEPNDLPEQATEMPAPGIARGVLDSAEGQQPDADHFRFRSEAGKTWIIETSAARQGSPADTKIDVLHPDGQPVLRYLLQAVRDSYITFRPIDSSQNQVRVKNWEEMELNQYLYMNGEVCKLFRKPQGPDSGFMFYTNQGKRRGYFDTSATIHALEDPVYIVEAYPPGTELVDNGLPVFPLYYSNDDDADRELGNDSRLTFTAPAEGEYVVRVTDVRGFGGSDFQYTLTVRDPRPDFEVSIAGKGATIGAGSGQQFTVKLKRLDNFSGEVRIDLDGLPPGVTATTPIVVQTDHLEAHGVIHLDPNSEAPEPEAWANVSVTARAVIHGQEVVKPVGDLGEIKAGPTPEVLVFLEPDLPGDAQPDAASPNELVIAPGTRTTARLRIERNGFEGELNFDVNNLPHGVIVDDIGLNGILIRADQNERRIFLNADDWVPGTTRLVHAITRGQGNQASRPIQIRVAGAEAE